MIPFNVLFEESDSEIIEYKGKLINWSYKINVQGEYDIKLTFINSNSKYKQAIVVGLYDFVGEFYIFDEKIKIPKKRFPTWIFWEDAAPKEIKLKIVLKEGKFEICNGSDSLGDKRYCQFLYWGCAIFIEELGNNKYRFHCNDHEIDDDFDDLIFDMEIEKIN